MGRRAADPGGRPAGELPACGVAVGGTAEALAEARGVLVAESHGVEAMPWRALGLVAFSSCFVWQKSWRQVAAGRYLEEELEVEHGRLRLLRSLFEQEEVEELLAFMRFHEVSCQLGPRAEALGACKVHADALRGISGQPGAVRMSGCGRGGPIPLRTAS